jgi:chaperonin GroES
MSLKNQSGINPTEYRVLVKPEKVEEKTQGGIIIPDQTKDRDQYAVVKGTLVSVSPLAFTYADWPEGSRVPQPGDRVAYEKYAGALMKGNDGEDYRVVNDRDVHAVLD